jgi:hypothetical protein
MDMVASNTDRSKEAAFGEAVTSKSYYGPVYFRHESEPYMTIALAACGPRHTVAAQNYRP